MRQRTHAETTRHPSRLRRLPRFVSCDTVYDLLVDGSFDFDELLDLIGLRSCRHLNDAFYSGEHSQVLTLLLQGTMIQLLQPWIVRSNLIRDSKSGAYMG